MLRCISYNCRSFMFIKFFEAYLYFLTQSTQIYNHIYNIIAKIMEKFLKNMYVIFIFL